MISQFAINKILDKYKHLIKKGTKRDPNITPIKEGLLLQITLHLIHHPVHKDTRLHIMEIHYKDKRPKKYRYAWEWDPPSLNKDVGHITSWENEPHDDKEYQTPSEPHHHHYVPGDRSKRKESWTVREFEQAIKEIEPFVAKGLVYKA